ncbi:MAG: HPr family phosphocarrier protein [Planctomycetes bacterium]|nr:HPr family phosphocarrier protein [Planctomycetota bacterium]
MVGSNNTPVELRRVVELVNKYGMHARPAMKFVECASRFQAELYVVKGEQEVNGKSVMGMMMLAAERGEQLTLRAVGGDAEGLLEAIATLVGSRFGEE